MINLNNFLNTANNCFQGNYGTLLHEAAINKYKNVNHGDFKDWLSTLEEIKSLGIEPYLDASNSFVCAGKPLNDNKYNQLHDYLKRFIPWRKGPYNLAGVEVDAEWRSDFKWDRLKDHINLKNKTVLDIGTGSGYHLWRMHDAGAYFVLGIEPYLRFCMQFCAVKSLTPQDKNVFMLPLTLEEMPIKPKTFDYIFSMGLLYHRKAPFDHLIQIKNMLKDNGSIVLETMVVEGDENTAFTPIGRYAKMQNVWFIPSVECCKKWLEKCGYKNVRVIDITKTTIAEQRQTQWMIGESLEDFLNPNDSNLTIENAPAPIRAIFVAEI